MSIFESLGLDKVESDPNALPDGKWAGEVFKSEYVEKKDGGVSHVITYRVTDGERKGAQRQEWWNLGNGSKKNEAGHIVGIETPTMTENQKPWYKKRFEDLGETADVHPSVLVGKKVFFGTKKNGSYINVNFVELRPDASAVAAPASGGAEAPGILGSL